MCHGNYWSQVEWQSRVRGKWVWLPNWTAEARRDQSSPTQGFGWFIRELPGMTGALSALIKFQRDASRPLRKTVLDLKISKSPFKYLHLKGTKKKKEQGLYCHAAQNTAVLGELHGPWGYTDGYPSRCVCEHAP